METSPDTNFDRVPACSPELSESTPREAPPNIFTERLTREERRVNRLERIEETERRDIVRRSVRAVYRGLDRTAAPLGQDELEQEVLAAVFRSGRFTSLPHDELSAFAYRAAQSKIAGAHRSRWANLPRAAAGWYADPDDDSRQRYWDGVRWTRRVRAGVEEATTFLAPTDRIRRQPSVSVEELSAATGDAWQPATVGPFEDQLDAGDSAREALGLVEALPARQREALRLAMEGMSYRDIAEHLDITPGAANTRLVHARQKLAVLMGAEGLDALITR